MKRLYLNIILFLILCLFVSCEPDKVCHQELQATMQVVLSADSVTSAGDTVAYVQWDSVAVIGVGNTMGIKGKSVKTMALELRPDTTITQYLVQYHNQIDTLFIEHTPKVQYISMACGCAIFHTITSAWSSDPRVDSVSIINANVESVAQNNLFIHMHE